jgi:hypothetical protein
LGLGDVEVVDGGDKSGLGEVRHEELGGGMAAGARGDKDSYEEIQMEDGVSVIGLEGALNRLLDGGGVEGEEREVMLITLEDGDEPVLLQADIIGAGVDGERGEGELDKETILKLVRDYLRKKDKSKRSDDEEKKAERDEL